MVDHALQALEFVAYVRCYIDVFSFFDAFCVFLVTLGCGSTSSENLTYFEVSNANEGQCTAKICKQDGVCQVQ